jgi:hypothetical protein
VRVRVRIRDQGKYILCSSFSVSAGVSLSMYKRRDSFYSSLARVDVRNVVFILGKGKDPLTWFCGCLGLSYFVLSFGCLVLWLSFLVMLLSYPVSYCLVLPGFVLWFILSCLVAVLPCLVVVLFCCFL